MWDLPFCESLFNQGWLSQTFQSNQNRQPDQSYHILKQPTMDGRQKCQPSGSSNFPGVSNQGWSPYTLPKTGTFKVPLPPTQGWNPSIPPPTLGFNPSIPPPTKGGDFSLPPHTPSFPPNGGWQLEPLPPTSGFEQPLCSSSPLKLRPPSYFRSHCRAPQYQDKENRHPGYSTKPTLRDWNDENPSAKENRHPGYSTKPTLRGWNEEPAMHQLHQEPVEPEPTKAPEGNSEEDTGNTPGTSVCQEQIFLIFRHFMAKAGEDVDEKFPFPQ